MVLEVMAIILATISAELSVFAIYDTRKINKETSDFLIKIETYSKNINERSMSWLEQLIFDRRRGNPAKPTKKDNISEPTLLNFLYDNKGATFKEIMKGLNTDYATVRFLLKKLNSLGLVRRYEESKGGLSVFYLPETREESLKKYPKKESKIPF